MLASLTKDQIKEMLPTIGDRIQLIELLKEIPASSLHTNTIPPEEATTCTTSQCLTKKELLKRAAGGSLAAIAATKHWNVRNKWKQYLFQR